MPDRVEILLQFFAYPYHLLFQVRDIFYEHLPCQLQVYSKIFMDENVPHTGYFFPRDIWIPCFCLFRNILDRFTNNLDTADCGILELNGGHEVALVLAFDIIFDKPDALKDMVYEYSRILLHRINTCSFNILSLSRG